MKNRSDYKMPFGKLPRIIIVEYNQNTFQNHASGNEFYLYAPVFEQKNGQ